jgi:hypothetical protein
MRRWPKIIPGRDEFSGTLASIYLKRDAKVTLRHGARSNGMGTTTD